MNCLVRWLNVKVIKNNYKKWKNSIYEKESSKEKIIVKLDIERCFYNFKFVFIIDNSNARLTFEQVAHIIYADTQLFCQSILGKT